MVFEYKDGKIYEIKLDDLLFPQDKRHNTLHSILKKYDRDDIAFIECDSLILECLKTITKQKLHKKYKKVIVYMSELYWDSYNSDYPFYYEWKDNIHFIFNFFSEKSPYKLLTNTYTSIGAFGDITKLYLEKYDFEKKEPKYNLISKFGRPNKDRIKFCKELQKYKSFVYSINNFAEAYGDEADRIESKRFESEKDLDGDYKSYTLPKEDFESIFSLDIETRLTQYESASWLVSCTEKTLKSFMFKRPSINVIQKEAYDYLESFGFEFPNYFGLDHKTQQLEICKRICELSLEECKELSLQYKDVCERNYQKLLEFLEHHKNKLENIFYELYHK